MRKMKKWLRDKFRKKWPPGCGYQGYEFGAGYLDSECFGGRLFDMDNCDGPGGDIYEPMEYIPCPACHRNEAIVYYAEQRAECSDLPSLEDFTGAISLVDDIRKNRGLDIPTIEETP